MSGKELAKFGAVVAGDILSIFVPGGGSAAAIAHSIIEKRRREAAEILIDELSSGHHGQIVFNNEDIEPLIVMTLRIARAVSDGTTLRNIQLLAQVIAGLKSKSILQEDMFLKWAKVVESLTRDEILILGFAYRAMQLSPQGDEREINRAFRDTFARMCQDAGVDDHQRTSICVSLSRTGLLLPVSAWGSLVYHPSPLLEELGLLIDLDSVKEGLR